MTIEQSVVDIMKRAKEAPPPTPLATGKKPVWYKAKVDQAQVIEDSRGREGLKLVWRIVEGDNAGRTVFGQPMNLEPTEEYYEKAGGDPAKVLENYVSGFFRRLQAINPAIEPTNTLEALAEQLKNYVAFISVQDDDGSLRINRVNSLDKPPKAYKTQANGTGAPFTV